jgi:hypothetical protein
MVKGVESMSPLYQKEIYMVYANKKILYFFLLCRGGKRSGPYSLIIYLFYIKVCVSLLNVSLGRLAKTFIKLNFMLRNL